MENEVLIALIAVMGVIFGAFITGIIQYFSSKQKLEELQISLTQKAYERQIESARIHLDDLYLPLYKEISSLLYHYTKYRNIYRIVEVSDQAKQKEVEEELEAFFNVISQFSERVENIFKNGMTAYLIGVIEERLIELRDLLEQSTKEPTGRVETKVTASIGLFGITGSKSKITTKKIIAQNIPKIESIEIGFPFFGKTKIENRLLKAPFESENFDKQFMEYITEIKREMREVTLWLKS